MVHNCIVSDFLPFPTLQIQYKKEAKANLHYTSVADRPDIRKATQAAKLISEVSSNLMNMYCRLNT